MASIGLEPAISGMGAAAPIFWLPCATDGLLGDGRCCSVALTMLVASSRSIGPMSL